MKLYLLFRNVLIVQRVCFEKFGPHENIYACAAKSKLTGDYNISIIQDYTKIPNWCPLLDQKNYIKKVTGELL